jgi:hypothetical protein
MKLYVLREYVAYGETHSEATREQIRDNEIVQQLIAEAVEEAIEEERINDPNYWDTQPPSNNK